MDHLGSPPAAVFTSSHGACAPCRGATAHLFRNRRQSATDMRALVVTNMWPTPEAPSRGGFVRDQVQALRQMDDVEVDVFAFGPGRYARAAWDLRARHRHGSHDVIHAHFGLSAAPALALRTGPHAVTL